MTSRDCASADGLATGTGGGLLGAALSVGGRARVMLTDLGGGGDPAEVAEVAGRFRPEPSMVNLPPSSPPPPSRSELFAIVTTSTEAGYIVDPFALAARALPSKSGTTMVCMDILGVVITSRFEPVFAHFGGAAVVAAAAGGVVP